MKRFGRIFVCATGFFFGQSCADVFARKSVTFILHGEGNHGTTSSQQLKEQQPLKERQQKSTPKKKPSKRTAAINPDLNSRIKKRFERRKQEELDANKSIFSKCWQSVTNCCGRVSNYIIQPLKTIAGWGSRKFNSMGFFLGAVRDWLLRKRCDGDVTQLEAQPQPKMLTEEPTLPAIDWQKLPEEMQELKSRADQGDAEAQYDLSERFMGYHCECCGYHRHGAEDHDGGRRHVAEDHDEEWHDGDLRESQCPGAAHLYALRKFYCFEAAKNGSSKAQYDVSRYFCSQNESERTRWLQRAADNGHVLALYDLGVRCCQGRGVPKDESLGKSHLKQAANLGHPNAVRYL
jgi:hypothetical protein